MRAQRLLSLDLPVLALTDQVARALQVMDELKLMHLAVVEEDVYKGLVWKRISEVVDDPQMIVDGIHPNDIKQGYLGDCYLLAVMSAMCEFPE